MALSTLSSLKTHLGVTGTGQDTQLTAFLEGAIAAVKTYLRGGYNRTAFSSWPESGADTQYISGNGRTKLVLKFRPVTAVASVYLDPTGYFGKGTSPFASSTLLTDGSDYVLDWDETGSVSSTGILLRIRGTLAQGEQGPWWPFIFQGGTLVARQTAAWPYGQGNIKITYTSGFSAVPDDLELAVNNLAAWIRANAKRGGQPLSSESLSDYSYSLASSGMSNSYPELGTVRQLLSSYRDILR